MSYQKGNPPKQWIKKLKCGGCGDIFSTKTGWQRACSRKCWQRVYRKTGAIIISLKKQSPMKGKHQTEKAKQKISKKMRKNKASQWKGNRASYISKHWWNKKWWGNPDKCESCCKKGQKVNKRWNIQWANISGKYKRTRNDWIGLCVPCHTKYDNTDKK